MQHGSKHTPVSLTSGRQTMAMIDANSFRELIRTIITNGASIRHHPALLIGKSGSNLGRNGRTQHAFCPGCLMAALLTNAACGISATERTRARDSVPG